MDILGHNLNVVCEVDGVISSQFRYPGLSPLHHLAPATAAAGPPTHQGRGGEGRVVLLGLRNMTACGVPALVPSVHLSTHTC